MNNDVWSLGVILVNLTCGRNPWRQASMKDETFSAYVQNPDFLRTILPISLELNQLLKRIFTLDPEERITLRELLHAITELTAFTMSESELRWAHAAAQITHTPTGHSYTSAQNEQPRRSSQNDPREVSETMRGKVGSPGSSAQHTPQLEHNRTLSSSEDDARLPQTPPCVPDSRRYDSLKSDQHAPATIDPSRSPSPFSTV
ncbi:hypothetical protein QFC19_006305 [Naganishia cerealis]|uniref:Uncharacterized protein n=1 Tax=Naganishia cerealis TaxID=610337 RepID=A0ACC2VJ09_9TREE|nr:hypothetical protein QFC19_006305 [Naganishia cerealis]